MPALLDALDTVALPNAGTAPNAADPVLRARLTPAITQAFGRLADFWALTEQEQLALLGDSVSRSRLYQWRRAEPLRPLNTDQMLRLSYLLGIYEGLMRTFRQAPEQAAAWLRRPRPEPPFHQRAPLDVMIGRQLFGLAAVRFYVDGLTGGPASPDEPPRPAGLAPTPAREITAVIVPGSRDVRMSNP